MVKTMVFTPSLEVEQVRTLNLCADGFIFCYRSLQRKIYVSGLQLSAQKGQDIDLWAESIMDGRRPDFLVLFALNVLIETHTAVDINKKAVRLMAQLIKFYKFYYLLYLNKRWLNSQ